MNQSNEFLENRSAFFWAATGVLLVSLIGIADFAVGYEVSFSLFYLIPIALVAWYAEQNLGVVISALSSLAWLAADIGAGHVYSRPVLYAWNTLIRFAFYIISTYLISELRKAHETQQTLARTDFVSGAMNARSFHEVLEVEAERSRRYPYPFTLVFIDVDNFKTINDRFGHKAGDGVLRFIANELKRQLRRQTSLPGWAGMNLPYYYPSLTQLRQRPSSQRCGPI